MFGGGTKYTFLLFLFFAEEIVDSIVNCGAVPALVRHLEVPVDDECVYEPYEYEVEKRCAVILGLLAVKVIKLHCFFFSF